MNISKLLTIIGLIISSSTFNFAQNLSINEIMASNTATISDEFGEYDDWIEIHNSGITDINLGGYYLSDTASDPLLWEIPSNNPAQTTIPAGGFLILWADKDTDQGAHHLDFKLSASGESVILTSPSMNTIDELNFSEQNPDISYGSTEDGGGDFQYFFTPTPNASNNTSGTSNTFQIIYTTQISSINDDAEELSNGNVNLISGDIELGKEGLDSQTVAFRFSDIDLPNGIEVTEAYLQLTTDEVSSNDCELVIRAQASANAEEFIDVPLNLSGRSTTNSSVDWSVEAWNQVGEANDNQLSPNIGTVINEVLASSDWQAENALAILIEGTGTRTAIAYDSDSLSAAQLIIKADYPVSNEPILPIKINEIAAYSSDFLDETGKAEDWIELFNPNDSPVFVGGLYLSDDLENPTKWRISSAITIEPLGFVTIFADKDPEEGGLHANFSLDNDGEDVILSQVTNNNLTTIDQVSFPELAFKASYGRETDGSDTFVRFGQPTPNASNNGALLFLEAPIFSLEAGLYEGSQNLILSHPLNDVDIHYNSSSNVPSTSDQTYSDPIVIDTNTSIRAIAYKDGYAPSPIVNKNYTFGLDPSMPVLYITTAPDNFFSDEMGIYVEGTNGTIGFCATEPVNWAQDWERPANLQLILPDGTMAFDVNAGVKIAGACSRSNPVKSLNIYLREQEYGDKRINYPLFPQRDHSNYRRLKLRNSGQDLFRMGFRDALNHNLILGEIDVDLQASKSVLVYLNGEFWAIQNLRENYHGEYFEAVFDVDEEDLDFIKSPGLPWNDVKEGNVLAYTDFFEFLESSDFTNETDYQEFKDRADWNEFLNYWITTTYMANYDWPANNLGIWRERKDDAKWRYAIQDTDGSTGNGLSSSGDAEFNTLEIISNETSTSWPNHKNSTLALRKLWENDEFRGEYIQRTCSIINLLYNDDRIESYTDSLRNLYAPHVPAHLDNWGSEGTMGGTILSWNTWVDKYIEFYADRKDYFRGFMAEKFSLTGTYNLNVNFNENTGGRVVVNFNEMTLPYNYEGLYMQNVPVRLTAKANPGYIFSHWIETGETTEIIDYTAFEDATITPVFVVGCDLTVEDMDNDGICDENDNCLNTPNPEQEDIDGDGIGDACDDCDNVSQDADNDGVCDDIDNCPNTPNPEQEDLDGDGIGDNCDDCDNLTQDADNDGVCDNIDNCPSTPNSEQVDVDGDGIGDACDDCDNLTQDADADGVCDDIDNCPNTPNPEQADSDGDGIGDSCDDCDNLTQDADNDGVCDDIDNCPNSPNPNQSDIDEDGIGDICDDCDETQDIDEDGVCDLQDNCLNTPNPEQEDIDSDGIGDSCDDCNNLLVGTSCDDENECTDDDIFDAECNCIGTFIDNDDDGICAAEDCDDNDANLPQLPGTSCDDGNLFTIDDVYLEDGCTCQGVADSNNYCETYSENPFTEFIEQVTFNMISNSSVESQYSDFTNISTTLEEDESYAVSLYGRQYEVAFTNYWRIWIDYDHSLSFEPNELVIDIINPTQVSGASVIPVMTIAQLPETLVPGLTGMRVIYSRDPAAEPCGVISFGEVEDYTVDLKEAGVSIVNSNLLADKIRLYPNPVSDILKIDFSESEVKYSQLEIYNALGMRMLQQEMTCETECSVSVENWNSGIYWLRIQNEEGIYLTRSFVVE